MDLYSAFLTTAPFILLAISSGIVFGPVPASARHRAWRLPTWQVVTDVSALLIVVAGAGVSLLALGEVLPPSDTVRTSVVTAGVFSLFLLLLHCLADVIRLYRSDRETSEGAGPSAEPESIQASRTSTSRSSSSTARP